MTRTPLAVADILALSASRTPRRAAATLGDRTLTFAELETRTRHLARSLDARGVGYGMRVAWWGETSLEAVPLWFALARLGAVIVPINPRMTDEEADEILDRADTGLVVTDDAHRGDVAVAELERFTGSTGISPPAIDEDDPHVVFFTSGSSGRPKGVQLSHRATRLRTMTDATQWPGGPAVCMFPQFHMAAWYAPMTTWASGDEVVFVPRATAADLLTAIDRRRATRIYAIPAVWRRILDADRSALDLTCLQTCDTGTSAVTPELLSEIAAAFPGTETSITYGSTEAGGVCRLWPRDVHRKPGSVGPAAPGCDIRLGDDGEIRVHNPFLMTGYFRDEEATHAAFADGYFRTGDLATRDEDGYYSIVGRAKEVIRTGGEWVAPVEVDTVLARIPGVVDAAVVGVPDETWGEVVTAFLVLAPGTRIDLPTVRRHCAERLSAFKHPRHLIVVDALPRTGATGQVQRQVLRQTALAAAQRTPDDAVSR